MALSTNTELKAALASWLKRGDLTTQIPDFIFLAEKAIERELNFGPTGTQDYTTSAATTASQDWIYAPIGCVEPVFLRLESDPERELGVVSLRELARKRRMNNSGTPEVMAQVGDMRAGVIESIADDTEAVLTSTAHGLSDGDIIYITGTTSHNGKKTVSEKTTDTFEITDAYVGAETGTWTTYQTKIMFDTAPTGAIDYTLFYKAKFEYLGDTEVTWLLSEYPDLILYGALVTASPYLQRDQRVPMWAQFFQDTLRGARLQQWRKRTSGGELRIRTDVASP